MTNLLLGALFISSLSVISVKAQAIVQCRASVNCDGAPGDDLGVMTARGCCVDNPNGLAYTRGGGETCTPCIVFGFLQDSFTGTEQGPGHMVEVGYQKGAAQAGVNLVLNVVSIPGTAREGAGLDYTINTDQVRLLFQSPDQRASVVFTFRVDAIAQEANETLDLQLVSAPGTPLPDSDGSFFENTLNMIIIDSDIVQISFTEDDFRANEQNLEMPVRVTKNVRIANPIELDIVPLTVQQAQDSSPPLSLQNLPEDNLFSPPFADLNDFNSTVLSIIFEADESSGVNDMSTPVAIFDDPVNEASEQAFIVQLKLISSTNPVLIVLTERPVSLCRIVDNDPIRIGFELPSYTFLEPQFDEAIDQSYVPESGLPINGPVYLVKENNVTTEQTFQITIQISNVTPSGQGPATSNEDYVANEVSTIPFPPTEQRLVFQFELLADDVPEDTEAFQIGSTPSNQPGVPIFQAPSTFFPQTFVIIQDDDVVPIIVGFEDIQYNVGESVGSVEVFVNVSMPVDGQMLVGGVSLLIQSVAGTAVGGEDYIEINAETFDQLLDFSDANRRLSFNVTIINDNRSEMREDFSLELRFDIFLGPPPSGVTLSPNVTTITIEDDDDVTGVPSISFEKESYTVKESDGYVEVCFFTNTGHNDSIDIEITPVMKGVDAPAASDSDFASMPRMQTFAASSNGSMLCVNITIIEDFIYEDDEQFLVVFGNLPNGQAGLGPINQTCVTITDDDVPEFNIGPTTSVNESTPDIEICVSTSSSLGRNVIVTAVTGPKSGATNQAIADLDYVSTTVMLTFMSSDEGTQTICFNVSIIDDLLGNEPDEEFSVAISDSEIVPAGSVGANAEACITITDNDTPEVEWSIPNITILEGNNETVCFTTNIGTATPYDIVISARPKGQSPATTDDYDIPQASLMITVPVSENGSIICIDLVILEDSVFEDDEQFELIFQNLPSEFATVGAIDIVCVTIADNDSTAPTTPPPPSDVMMCRITEPLRVQPYTRTSMYGFMGTCEHIATSPCETIPDFDVRVTVDFLTESLENGAMGLHVNNLRYVSREDGSFDDGGQTPISSTPTNREYAATDSTLVSISFGQGQTNITFDSNTDPNDPLDTIIEVIHTYGGDNSSIQISIQTSNNGVISDFCGLCGSRSGSLLKRDGTVANMMNMTQVQGFAQSYLVEPRDQILRPQRRECGTIRNDTVIGDPLYAAPVYSEDGKEYNLCYEVFGRTNSTFNLVSDTCVNVNARYGPMNNPEEGNIITAVGVRARGLSEDSCHNIHIDLEGCSATIETPDGNSTSLGSMERFESDGISVRKYPTRVRISAPNCENVMLVMWVICENINNQDMIKFVIARGLNLRPSSHGLLGQFWSVPVTFVKYNGTDVDLPPDMLEEIDNFYIVTVQPWAISSPSRSFLGLFFTQKWDNSAGPCLYVGNAQGGPSFEVEDPNDSVIEGEYFDYLIPSGDIFETGYKFAQFDEKRC